MARQLIQDVLHWLSRVVSQPRDELTRWQRTVRFAYDLGRYGARQLRRDRAAQMAAALSFRTLFGLLPMLVVGTVLVKAFGGFGGFRDSISQAMGSLGLDEIRVSSEPVVGAETAEQSLHDWLLNLLSQAEGINLTAITWIGVAILIYSAVSLVATIEGSFNIIYRASGGRSWTRRIPIYWTMLTFAPAAIGLATYANREFHELIRGLPAWLHVARLAWTFLVSWLIMFAVYKLMPNTKVRARPAMIGAFVAAALIEIGKQSMGAYLQNAVTFRQLYGSLGLIPLFMFWVYLMWLVVLFGLQVSATLQMLAGRSLEEVEKKQTSVGLVEPAAVLTVMEVVAARFESATPTTSADVSERTGVAESTVRIMFDRLVAAGMLHWLDRDDGAVSLAQPPEGISAADLMDIGFSLVDESGVDRGPAILERLRAAQRTTAGQTTLAGLMPSQAG